MRKKKLVLSYELFFKYGGEGGLTRFARPAGSPFAARPVCPTGCARCRPRSGVLIPPECAYAKKKPILSYGLFLKYGGEGGIRTPDTLPYTHFPGVLLQPLGHLTKLSLRVTGTGANLGKYRACVNQLFAKTVRLHKLPPTCSLIERKLLFLPASGNLLC